MKRIRLGEPEKIVPSAFCDNFNYSETSISYPLSRITAKDTPRGFLVEFPIEDDAHIYGFGLQLKQFDHRGRKLKLSVNADPVSNNGDSHAPVPFFATNKGYGMYFDTARYIEVYCGYTKKTLAQEKAEENSDVKTSTDELYAIREQNSAVMSVLIPAAHGIDIYIMEGKNITGRCFAVQYALRRRMRCTEVGARRAVSLLRKILTGRSYGYGRLLQKGRHSVRHSRT